MLGGLYLKLIAIDLDGTLLLEDGTISKPNIDAILDVQKQGDVIAICSGRSFHDTQNIIRKAGIDCPIITGNGAIAYHSQKLLQNLIMPEEITIELVKWLELHGYYYEVYTNQGIFLLENGKDRLKDEVKAEKNLSVEWANQQIDLQFAQFGLHFVNDFSEIAFGELEVYKVYVMSFNKEKLQQLKERLEDRMDLSLTTSGWTKLEIAHKDTNKGSGICAMAQYLHIPLKNTVAIGDNFNDLPMFEIAGTSIAMGNAEAEVKEQSTYVTRDFNEDGVAFALRQYVLKGE